MEKIVTTQEMKELDKLTIEGKNITSLSLMQEVGQEIYKTIVKKFSIDKNADTITIIAGPGNNGIDALFVGYYLIQNNFSVKVVVVCENISNDASKIMKTMNAEVLTVDDLSLLEKLKERLNNSSFIIDGLFGIGLNRKVDGLYKEVINCINNANAIVISIDIPSGINGDNGLMYEVAVQADFTVVVQNYKVGNLLNDAKDYHGEIEVIDVGIVQKETGCSLLTKEDLSPFLKRKNNTHKYHYGSILTFGGNIGMTGAPLMCAYSALKSGSGLSTIAIKEAFLPFLFNIYPEVMVKPYRNESYILKLLEKKDVIVFGPGLGRDDEHNYEILDELIRRKYPLLIDADGLFYLKEIIQEIKDGSNIIITPHIGELSMLMNVESEEISKDPLKYIKILTDKYSLNVVLKGTCSIIANKEKIYFSNYGNPGMATAGSGDVLSGVIASFIGQGFGLLESAKLGVYVHSLAGNEACKEFGEYSMTATDIINNIHKVIKELSK